VISCLVASCALAVPTNLRFRSAVGAYNNDPTAKCKLTKVSSRDQKEYGGLTDVDLYFKNIMNLIRSNQKLYEKKVKVSDIIPNSGSGTYFHGCPHYKPSLEDVALLVNDIDGMCMSDACDEAFAAELEANDKFYHWGQPRKMGGLQVEMEVFNAKKEAASGVFAQGKPQYWKSKMLELYTGSKKVTPVSLKTTSGKFCVPKPEDSSKSVPQYGCPQCLTHVKTGKCTNPTGGVKPAVADGVSGDWCELHCIPGVQEIKVPDCKSMCYFKRTMLSGTTKQRKSDNKLKQDLLDLKCLMAHCNLNHLCEAADGATMPADLANVGYGPTGNMAPPRADMLVPFMGTELYTEPEEDIFPCKKFNGKGKVTGTFNGMTNIETAL